MQNYVYPSSSNVTLTGSTNGTPIPTTSIVVGGENAAGNTEPLQLDASNYLLVTLAGQSLSDLNVNIDKIGGVALTLGQKVMASSIPVVLSSDQSAIPVSQSGVWSVGRTWALASGTDSIDAVQSGTWNINNISGTISLPTGASTSALQTQISGQLPAALGAQLIAGSLAVNIASDQTVPVSATSLPLPSGAATSALQTQISGQIPTTLGQKAMAASLAVAIASDQSAIPASQSGTWTTARSWTLASGTDSVSAVQSGTWATETLDGSGNAIGSTSGALNVAVTQPLPAGTNSIGKVSVPGTAKANAPVYNDYTSTSITTSAYVQLVASTSNEINNLHIFDSSGQAMILAIGGAGSEVDTLYVPPGGDTYGLNIPAGSRISYKALTASATSGYLLMSFLE